jgi:putative FmdB family regulatory protein
MERTKFAMAFVLVAAAIGLLVYRLLPGPGGETPVYDWECAKCQTRFREGVVNAAADVPVIDCPKCKTKSAERVMHFQCRQCWKKYDRRGSQATLAQIVCPACGSRAARDLDHPIPGDDEPVEGGQPYPGK